MQITTEIDPELYNKASKILSEIELTVEEFDTDDLPSFDTVEDLMRDLNNEKK